MAIGQISQLQVKDLSTDLAAKAATSALTAHTSNTANPHGVTAAQVGALPTSQKGAANGVASLDSNGKIPSSQIPSIALGDALAVADQAARYALSVSQVQNGDLVRQSDTGGLYSVIDDANLDNSSGWLLLTSPSAAPVDSVFGRTGAVTAQSGDYDSDKISNTSTINGGAGSVSDALEATASSLSSHASNTSNPHGVTAGQVGAYTISEVNTKLADVSNLGGGSVSNTEFSYLDGVTSNIQAQITAASKPPINQTPSGTANGSNTDFLVKKLDGTTTVAADPTRTMVTLERLPQIAGTDFTWVSGNTIVRFSVAPPSGWNVRVYGYEA